MQGTALEELLKCFPACTDQASAAACMEATCLHVHAIDGTISVKHPLDFPWSSIVFEVAAEYRPVGSIPTHDAQSEQADLFTGSPAQMANQLRVWTDKEL